MEDGKGTGREVGDQVGSRPRLTEEQGVHVHGASGRECALAYGGVGGVALYGPRRFCVRPELGFWL